MPVHYAAMKGKHEIVDAIAKAGGDISSRVPSLCS